MAVWTAPENSASERVGQLHQESTGTAAAHTASAPGTFVVIGENADHYGGVTVVGLSELQAAVAVSPRQDATIRVNADFAGVRSHDEAEGARIASIGDPGFTAFGGIGAAANDVPQVNSVDTELPAGTDGLALRFGGLVHSLIGRQLLSRETSGMDISVVSDIPLGAGLGALHAADAALGLALLAEDEEIHGSPLRARLAEIASHSTETFTSTPVLRARHSAALRGAAKTVSVVDYADGSVTQASHPERAGLRIFAVAPSFGSVSTEGNETVKRIRQFLDDACANFGVASLRQLPDAADRVVEWVSARHQVYGADSAPSINEARDWVTFGETETQQALDTARALRSARFDDAVTTLNRVDTLEELATPAQLIELLTMRGAAAARPAAAGMSQAAIAYVPESHAANFAADLAADGFAIVEITPGTPGSPSTDVS